MRRPTLRSDGELSGDVSRAGPAPAGGSEFGSGDPRFFSAWQEWRDSNPRPSVLETDALTRLSYTPKAASQIASRRAIRKARLDLTLAVIPAKAGTSGRKVSAGFPAVPAFAGTTSLPALAIGPAPRYLATLACIGKARLTGPPVEGGCPKGAIRRTRRLMAKVNPGEFLRQVRSETGKVSWPTRKETVTTSIMVLIMTSLLGIFFFGVDSAFALLVRTLLGLIA